MKFIIDFKNEATQTQIDAYFAANSCTVDKTFSAFEHVYLVDALSQPAADALVDSIVEDTATALNLLSMNWSTSSMDDWWKISSALKPDLNAATVSYDRPTVNSSVYMVDSGIQTTHAEFANARVSNLFSFNGDFTDFNGHGTALASVIVGETCGIVDARVKSVKIFQNGTPTLLSDLLSAFDAIYLDGQAEPTTLKIVNLSWAIAKNTYVESKIQQLMDLGYIVVASAGNNGSPIDNVTPASMTDVITVGAYNSDFEPCDFSNYTGYLQTTNGPVNYGALDAWSPGQDIRVANISGGTSMTAGTSIAAAIQSAAIAFNSKLRQLTDGSFLEYLRTKDQLVKASTGKSGMLTLNAPYENSVNKIAFILTGTLSDNNIAITKIQNVKWTVVSGEALPGIFFFPSIKYASYDASALPNGLYFNNGFLLGTINRSVEEIIQVPIPVTYVDGTTDTVQLKLIVILPTTDKNDPQLDQEIVIQLNDNLCASTGNCGGGCDSQFGQPNCFNCLGEPKNPFACQCIAVECEIQ